MEQTQQIRIDGAAYKRLLKCQGRQALQITARYPRLVSEAFGARKINRYYKAVAHRWFHRWEGALLRRACDSMAASDSDFRPWEALYDFTATYSEGGLISLYTDAYEFTGGAHGDTVRRGDTWELSTGAPRTLYSFYPKEKRPKQFILERLLAQAKEMQASGEHLFFDDYEALMRAEFDPNRFYITNQGVALFYPLYAIAPYAEGFPTFVIPTGIG